MSQKTIVIPPLLPAPERHVIYLLPPPEQQVVYLLPPPPVVALLPANVDTPLETVALRLVYPQRSLKARKAGAAHLAVTSAFRHGRLHRAAGDPLCKPASEWPGMLDFVPPGVRLCDECAAIAERHDLALPEGLEADVPSTFEATPGADVVYKERSRWFNYSYGFPFADYLRKWRWLEHHCVCAECGLPVSLYDSRERVLGQPSAYYRKCQQGHLLKDGRDLKWKKAPVEKDGTEVQAAYSWLVAVPDSDIPF